MVLMCLGSWHGEEIGICIPLVTLFCLVTSESLVLHVLAASIPQLHNCGQKKSGEKRTDNESWKKGDNPILITCRFAS